MGGGSERDPTRAAYAAWAASYDEAPNATRDADAAVMRALAPSFAGRDVLEFGCGTGKNTVPLAAAARRVLALDLTPEMLDRARARGLPATVALERIERGAPWPTPDGSMDVVTASLVLEHIEELAPVFREAARVLRVDGWLWISELHPFRQLRGSRAHFADAEGRTRSPRCFPHGFSEYVSAGRAAGFSLEAADEPSDGGVPRLLVLGFRLGQRAG